MGERMRGQIFAALVSLFVVIAALVGLYLFMNNRIDYSTIDYIESCQRGPNSFSDLAGSINVSSADDIGYQVKGKYHLLVKYGDMSIDIPKTAFFNDEFITRIGKIGIQFKYKEDPETGEIKYRVTYWDEVVDEYSRVN